jgi:hypothetical protein
MKALVLPTAAFLGAALMIGSSVAAQTPDRLTDKDVKAIIEAVDHGRDRFNDQLDGKVKDSILREPTREVNVAKFLDDFKDNVDRLKDRFESKYSAGAEAAAVLRQATAIDRFMKRQSGDLKGASDWQHLAASLDRLAMAYGTRFPLETDSSAQPTAVRRINDGEAAAAAAAIEDQADAFNDAVNKEPALAEPAKTQLKDAAALVKEKADTLKSRLEHSEPATAEARMLFDAVRRMEASASGLALSPAGRNMIGSLRTPLATVYQAFGVASGS